MGRCATLIYFFIKINFYWLIEWIIVSYQDITIREISKLLVLFLIWSYWLLPQGIGLLGTIGLCKYTLIHFTWSNDNKFQLLYDILFWLSWFLCMWEKIYCLLYARTVEGYHWTSQSCWSCCFHCWWNPKTRPACNFKHWTGKFTLTPLIVFVIYLSRNKKIIISWNTLQTAQILSTCIFLGFEPDASLNIADRIRGPNVCYILFHDLPSFHIYFPFFIDCPFPFV